MFCLTQHGFACLLLVSLSRASHARHRVCDSMRVLFVFSYMIVLLYTDFGSRVSIKLILRVLLVVVCLRVGFRAWGPQRPQMAGGAVFLRHAPVRQGVPPDAVHDAGVLHGQPRGADAAQETGTRSGVGLAPVVGDEGPVLADTSEKVRCRFSTRTPDFVGGGRR